jgi:hypothetical protein
MWDRNSLIVIFVLETVYALLVNTRRNQTVGNYASAKVCDKKSLDSIGFLSQWRRKVWGPLDWVLISIEFHYTRYENVILLGAEQK